MNLNFRIKHFGFLIFIVFFACSTSKDSNVVIRSYPIDDEATFQTEALYRNLMTISNEGILFGHQDDLAYGVYWKDERI